MTAEIMAAELDALEAAAFAILQEKAAARVAIPETARVIHGDCLDVLRTLPADSVDAVITDPPYSSGGRQQASARGIISKADGRCILDPFAGSGTTGVAALLEGFDFIGVERDAAHVATARQRIADAQAQLTLGAA